MDWKIKFTEPVTKGLDKIDKFYQKMIRNYLKKKVATLVHPKQLGKALTGDLKGLWRYRIDKFRVICEIKEDKLIILVVKIGSRDNIYD